MGSGWGARRVVVNLVLARCLRRHLGPSAPPPAQLVTPSGEVFLGLPQDTASAVAHEPHRRFLLHNRDVAVVSGPAQNDGTDRLRAGLRYTLLALLAANLFLLVVLGSDYALQRSSAVPVEAAPRRLDAAAGVGTASFPLYDRAFVWPSALEAGRVLPASPLIAAQVVVSVLVVLLGLGGAFAAHPTWLGVFESVSVAWICVGLAVTPTGFWSLRFVLDLVATLLSFGLRRCVDAHWVINSPGGPHIL